MAVIALSASPRAGGNTETLLGRVSAGLSDGGITVDIVHTHDLNIQPCNGCGACEIRGRCAIDDPFQELFDDLSVCDGVIFASPLYFMNIPARAKAMVDRMQSFWAAKHRLGKDLFDGRTRPGMLVSCAGAHHGPGGSNVFRGFEDTMTYVFDALGLYLAESLLIAGVDEKGAVEKDLKALERAYAQGAAMADRIMKHKI